MEEQQKKKKLLFNIGIVLMVLWGVFWGIALVIPFLPLSTTAKTVLVPSSIIIGEVLFLIGAVFVGKEVVAKYKSYLNPKNWRKNKDEDEDV